MLNFSRFLKNNEVLLRVIHQHVLVFFKPGLLALLLIVLPFFLMFLLFRWQKLGLGIFLFLTIIGILAIIRVYLIWSYNVFLITNQRLILIKQKGFFDRLVAETDYPSIQDVAYRKKGFWQTIGKYGSLRIQAHGLENALVVSKIPRPDKVQQLLLELKKEASN
ncbi:MAG: PH domain-containing protein [Patescibacteria group bacterium]|jgi:hypothetical protein